MSDKRLASKILEYPRKLWSSHSRNAFSEGGANLNWLIVPDQYINIGRTDEARRLAYRARFKSDIDAADLVFIRDATHKGWELGGSRFRDMIEQIGERRAGPAVKARLQKT